MKTPYETRFKFGLDRLIFGKPKKKSRTFYWVLFVLYLMMAIVAQLIFSA